MRTLLLFLHVHVSKTELVLGNQTNSGGATALEFVAIKKKAFLHKIYN